MGTPTPTKQAQSNVQFDSYAEHIKDLKTGQMINSETIRSLAESVEQIASVVAEIQLKARTEAQGLCRKCKKDFWLENRLV